MHACHDAVTTSQHYENVVCPTRAANARCCGFSAVIVAIGSARIHWVITSPPIKRSANHRFSHSMYGGEASMNSTTADINRHTNPVPNRTPSSKNARCEHLFLNDTQDSRVGHPVLLRAGTLHIRDYAEHRFCITPTGESFVHMRRSAARTTLAITTVRDCRYRMLSRGKDSTRATIEHPLQRTNRGRHAVRLTMNCPPHRQEAACDVLDSK